MATANFRIPDITKSAADEIFAELNISPTQAVNGLYQYVVENKKLPFVIRTEIIVPDELEQKLYQEAETIRMSVNAGFRRLQEREFIARTQRDRIIRLCGDFTLQLEKHWQILQYRGETAGLVWLKLNEAIKLLAYWLRFRVTGEGLQVRVVPAEIAREVAIINDTADWLGHHLSSAPYEAGAGEAAEVERIDPADVRAEPWSALTSTEAVRLAAQRDIAQSWRRDSGFAPPGGYVLVYGLEVLGWQPERGDPSALSAGCVAFDDAGRAWRTYRANDDAATAVWLQPDEGA